MIGSSRETVTRIFGDFKRNNLLQVKGSSVTLKNKPALERLLQGN
jgi:CRP-like cAMP-binding protein